MLIDPDGEVIYRRNGDVPFVAASLYKLVLMVDILSQIEAGLLSNDTPLLIEARFVRPENGVDSRYDASWIGRTIPVDDALLATGAYSSNVAAEALLTRTTRARLQRVAVSLGLHTTWMAVNPANVLHEPSLAPADSSPGAYRRAVTFIDRFAYDGRVHITAPADIATFYRRLLEGTVVNRKVSASIMNILAQQVVNDRIPALLPPETHTVHKTGNLQGVVHDAGIIYTSDGPLILVVMAQDAADGAHVAEIQRQLAAVAFGDG
jgi:beta-lactamase class A